MYRAEHPLRGFDQECRVQVAENLGKRGIMVRGLHNLHMQWTNIRI